MTDGRHEAEEDSSLDDVQLPFITQEEIELRHICQRVANCVKYLEDAINEHNRPYGTRTHEEYDRLEKQVETCQSAVNEARQDLRSFLNDDPKQS
jgi:Divergent 4Fe-4S mono-cluster